MALLGLDTPIKQGVFGTYITLWVTCHMLVYASRQSGAPAYNATSVVLLTELIKLVMALTLYRLNDGNCSLLFRQISGSKQLLLRYLIPAQLYCVYNNLVYLNLEVFDPGTYNVLLQLRIVMTGVLYQMLFSRQLNRNQWRAILLIAAGCIVKESSKFSQGDRQMQANVFAWALLLVQMLCSVFAGVYNEHLLKGFSGSAGQPIVSTNLQNAYMYFNSALCNAAVLVYQGQLGAAVAPANLQTVFTPTILLVMAIMSTVGMVTGFFLKHLDSVLKAIASALEVVLTAALSWLFFDTPLNTRALVAVACVGGGVALYARPLIDTEVRYKPLRTTVAPSAESEA
uniref:Uncharacterized protein n=1 Tax=Calcidiscus leptoporus TaxID=127549 RepID=A0A7S0JCZ0_9EUKA|mmetsp:Transcript_50325/g.116179  ORF Transcript_50325/g.116179 Transcript_50325/m.116179 type:complete len:342 (+) Transcript_50325:8-1033(+)